jgi:hypothetical protein
MIRPGPNIVAEFKKFGDAGGADFGGVESLEGRFVT